MKKILTLICTLLCANVLIAQTRFYVGDLLYAVTSTNPAKVMVYEFRNNPTTVIIPETVSYNGTTYSVTAIGDVAFYNCSSLTSVTIPNSVTYVGGGVFLECNNLTSVTLSNNITSLPAYYEFNYYGFFEGCSSLTSITIPNSVTTIGIDAFYNCSSLTSVTIGNSVTSIGYHAFYNCSSLTTLNFNAVNCNDFSSGSDYPFYNLPITTINIGDSVERIPTYFAYNLDSLTSVSIGNSVTSIGDYAFYDCSSLTTLNFNAINCNDFNSNNHTFVDSPISTITIGENVQRIPNYFAYNNSLITSVNVPNSVSEIGANAFNGCSNVLSISLGNSVTSLGDSAFYGCSNITSIDIPNSATEIGADAFNGCDMMMLVNLGENLSFIGSNAFNGCAFLQSVNCLATNPPTLQGSSVFPNPNIATLTVPCGSLEAYSSPISFWNILFNGRISEDGYEVVANVNNDAFGSVAIENNCSTATLTATANACYQFVGWNDGNTENPRLVTLSSDTTLTANFEEIVFDTTITATINAGEMYSEFGFNESEAGTYVQNLQTVNGCDSTITLILDVNSSLMDVEHSELSFYPNPTNSKITFSSTIESIEVMDLSGRCVLTFSNAREINIESLPSGAYYLRLTNNDKAIMRKVIKE